MLPKFYELALRSPFWHEVEHLCFLGAALLFWWPVIQPWPSQPQWPRWAMIPYLFLADFQNTALAAFLIFCERVVYPSYAVAPRLLEPLAAGGPGCRWRSDVGSRLGGVSHPHRADSHPSAEFTAGVSAHQAGAMNYLSFNPDALQLLFPPVAGKVGTSYLFQSSERHSVGRDFGGWSNRPCSSWRSSSLPMACLAIR